MINLILCVLAIPAITVLKYTKNNYSSYIRSIIIRNMFSLTMLMLVVIILYTLTGGH